MALSISPQDLSGNRLRCVAGVAAVAPTLRTLRLQGNAIRRLEGVDTLMALESLDLRDTLVSSFQVRERLRVCVCAVVWLCVSMCALPDTTSKYEKVNMQKACWYS
jgi:hypothetical protein